MSSITQFFRNVSSEVRKVSWPKKKELTRYTITVVTTVIFLTIFFAVVDLGISSVVRWVLSL
ncbi:preprotein translocase subunit SecE [Bacillus thermotolerans]|uniref:Protein translocase subunit SecE n=1 Tax=Bacillus thermotolerans TaxID=1221996 RepID=A0A0F5HNG6_BACTR|nr:preprotein translocase subunit SecE [Bacillus thermotolerans]KKB34851.1 Preprotein translocase subunit SecE [Bacillus thermotolerans]KKB35842.1 Preprotein translocase subunit SecE [Bacillus thermotolerans]KKB40818.1 Preprotein translocase subunit SecE [Bacillus thermotolerans]